MASVAPRIGNNVSNATCDKDQSQVSLFVAGAAFGDGLQHGPFQL